ncbi:response regulator transcription factor [Streptomyces sp. F-1]|uniref:response regulator transcription factor n=1 Tax=Streptomyces sp. F-1 TaxID=463642 RepID=UPI00085C48FF|nr:response regulator [Streptomyces sp. F-1]SFY51048.1 Transcriptional regulatory protein CitT [Streptomyces sp. F-1]
MSTSPASASAGPGRPLSVLVVDDDFRVAGLHADVVAQTPGCAVAGTAHSAGAALALLERAESPIDLALVDLYLPDRPGLELLRALPCDTFVLSAAAEWRTVRSALVAGALAYLIKPFPPDELGRRLRGYVRYRQLTDADTVDQRTLDDALAALRESGDGGRRTPTAAHTVTRELVLRAVREAAGPLSAGEVAAMVGISRATAQRYLADMVGRGALRMRLRYGVAGRPEQEYREP